MSKFKNFLMATVAALGMSGGMTANANTNDNTSKIKKVVVPVSDKKRNNRSSVQYPTNVNQILEMAQNSLNKKQYSQCIDLCKRVLITGYKKHYTMASYLMGNAYMGQNNYKKAIESFELANKYYELHGVNQPDKNTDYAKMFSDALNTAYQKYKDATSLSTAKTSVVKKM